VLRFRSRQDFSYRGWHYLSPLDVALFSLTGDREWLCYVASNLDHHKSGLRNLVVRSFAFVANRVTFDRDMLNRTAHNLQVRHMGCEDLVVLFAISDFDGSEKKAQISKWLSLYSLNPHEEACLRHLAVGELVSNPFLFHFLWIQQYLWLSFACDPLVNRRDSLAEQNPTNKMINSAEAQRRLVGFSLNSDSVWGRIRAHPLMDSYINIE